MPASGDTMVATTEESGSVGGWVITLAHPSSAPGGIHSAPVRFVPKYRQIEWGGQRTSITLPRRTASTDVNLN